MAKTSESPLVGKKAPAFTLVNATGSKVKLSDLKGQWVVLYFYPKDDTPGCTVEACEFTEGIKGFENLGATVFGVSTDSIESHQKFIAKYKLKVALLSDPDHETMEKYGAWGKKVNYGREYDGVIRSTVIIDPNGTVAHHWRAVKSKGHAEKVRQKVQELQSVSE